MSFVTLDFETFYSDECGFKKQTTEEYLRDPQFHVIGVAVKEDDGETKWFTGADVEKRLRDIDWSSSAVLCHNAMFDAAILSWHYGIRPAFVFDTLCMSRAVNGLDASSSLAALAQQYSLGAKGTEVINAKDKRLQDFTTEELLAYGDYCINDVELTYALFHKLAEGFPESEFSLIDMTIRMFTQPVLQVDDALLVERLDKVREEKRALLSGLMQELSCSDEEGVRSILASNKQFAELLQSRGVVVPMKLSPTTGKMSPALAKKDEGFIALQEEGDALTQQLCAVRLGTKSTIEESRIERFINVGARNRGLLPIPLKYYGAHTGRWAGSDGINMQNLPSRDKDKKVLKRALVAPEGHSIINCDSSQIEARILAWWADQSDVVGQFARGDDVYSVFASKIFDRPIGKADPLERFIGKTCVLGLGYGTGAEKLRLTLRTTPPGADLEADLCESYVRVYRSENYRIVDLWKECDIALNVMAQPWTGQPYHLGSNRCVRITKDGIQLPNGLYIRYTNLRMEEGKMVYTSRRGTNGVWGGAVVENVVQALARIVVGEQMLKLAELGLRPCLTVHDAAVIVVPDEQLDEALATVTRVMSTAPVWAAGLPVACEAKAGKTYGDCS